MVTLKQAFGIRKREVVSLVGGGGKTTLMYALGRELAESRNGVLLTTTTKIWEPEPAPFFLSFISEDLPEIKKWVIENIPRRMCLLVARQRLASGKLDGMPPAWIDEIFSLERVSAIINEADGAAGRPLKAPRENEPVIPESTTLLVPVMGIEGVDQPLDEKTVFRSAMASRLLGMPAGGRVTEDAVVRLMWEGIRGRPHGARVIPLINKVDIADGMKKARTMARCILSSDPSKIRSVVLGQLRHSSSVHVVKKRKG